MFVSMALRWGICGAGKISHDFVVGVKTRAASEQRVVAIAARSLESATAFAERHGIEKCYGSYEDLAQDAQVQSTSIIAVTTLICSPLCTRYTTALLIHSHIDNNDYTPQY